MLVLGLALLSLAAGPGGLVDLKFREVELPDVFRLVARLANRNILVGREVKGKFTMDLKQVEPLKAIDLVAAVNRFQVIEKNGILIVGSPETVDSVLGPAPVETIPLRYGDAADLAEKLSRLYKGKLDIVADLRTNSLLIRKLGK